MELQKICIALVALMLAAIVIVPWVSAVNQATDVEGRGDIPYLYNDVSVYAANTQNSMGYSASPYFRPAKTTILSRLSSDYIFHFNGHGYPGKFQVSDSSDVWITGTELNSYSYPNMKFALFQCCNCGQTSSTNGNLVASIVGHGSGSTCAFGYAQELLTIGGAIQYSQGFWDAARGGSSPSTSHFSAMSRLQSSGVCQYTDDSYCHYTSLVSSGICSSSLVTSKAALNSDSIEDLTSGSMVIADEIFDEGKNKIREFSGIDDIQLRFSGLVKGRGVDHYTFTSDKGLFVINSATGRVEFAQFNDDTRKDLAIDQEEAYKIAETYMLKKTAGQTSSAYENSLKNSFAGQNQHNSFDTDYIFVWRGELHPDCLLDTICQSITGPDSTTVIVSSTGQIRLYSEFMNQLDTKLDLIPSLTEEQAREIAYDYYEKQGVTINTAEKTSDGLWIWSDSANDHGWISQERQFLAWVFYVKDEGEIIKGGQIAVDAHDGHIINYAAIT